MPANGLHGTFSLFALGALLARLQYSTGIMIEGLPVLPRTTYFSCAPLQGSIEDAAPESSSIMGFPLITSA